jgi:plasmid stability protein
MSESKEQITVHLPPEQVAWLRARAVRHDRSLAQEVRSIVYLAAMAEQLLGPTTVLYASATIGPASPEAA